MTLVLTVATAFFIVALVPIVATVCSNIGLRQIDMAGPALMLEHGKL